MTILHGLFAVLRAFAACILIPIAHVAEWVTVSADYWLQRCCQAEPRLEIPYKTVARDAPKIEVSLPAGPCCTSIVLYGFRDDHGTTKRFLQTVIHEIAEQAARTHRESLQAAGAMTPTGGSLLVTGDLLPQPQVLQMCGVTATPVPTTEPATARQSHETATATVPARDPAAGILFAISDSLTDEDDGTCGDDDHSADSGF